jgi:hypothetical protein
MIGEEYGVAKHSSLLNYDIFIELKRFIKWAKKKKKKILLICFLLKKVERVPFLLGATVFCRMAFSITTFS